MRLRLSALLRNHHDRMHCSDRVGSRTLRRTRQLVSELCDAPLLKTVKVNLGRLNLFGQGWLARRSFGCAVAAAYKIFAAPTPISASLSKKLRGPATTISIIHCFWLPVTTVAWAPRTTLLLGNWFLVGSSLVMAMGCRCRF